MSVVSKNKQKFEEEFANIVLEDNNDAAELINKQGTSSDGGNSEGNSEASSESESESSEASGLVHQFRAVEDDDSEPHIEPIATLVTVPEIVVTAPDELDKVDTDAKTELAKNLEKLEEISLNDKEKEQKEDPEKSFEIPDNFVMKYLKDYHQQYYNLLIQDLKEKAGIKTDPIILEDGPTSSRTNSTVNNSTTAKKVYDFPAVKSKGEEDAENLAKLSVLHHKYNDMIKVPMDAKKTITTNPTTCSNTNNTNNTINTNTNNITNTNTTGLSLGHESPGHPDKMGPNDYKIVLDSNNILVQNRFSGRIVLVTTNPEEKTTTYRPYYPANVTYAPNLGALRDSALSQIPMPLRKKVAAFQFAEKLRGYSHIQIKKFGWRLKDGEQESVIEKFLAEHHYTLLKAKALQVALGIDLSLVIHLRKHWMEISNNLKLNKQQF